MSDVSDSFDPTDRRLAEIQAAVTAGDMAGAVEGARRALAERLHHPLFFKLRGLGFEQQGQYQAAVEDMRSALMMAPEDAAALNVMGLCLGRLGRFREAADALNRALAIAPQFGAAAYNLGWTLESLGEPALARTAYEQALALEPDNIGALASLAAMAARAGERSRARELGQRALDIDPHEPTAIMALAIADSAEAHYAPAEHRLRRLLGDPGRLTPHARAVAQGLLGDALDGQGRTDEAFEAYRAENLVFRQMYAPRFGAGAPESGLDYVNRLTAYFERSPAGAWTAPAATGGSDEGETASPPCRSHVFVMGFPRSGTTLLGQVLAAHPEVSTLDERETLLDAVGAFMTQPEDLDRLKDLQEAELEDYREQYWRRVREYGGAPEGKVFVDKLPMNTLKLPIIARLFPQAKILFARRDPRDVVLSCLRRHFVINPTTYEFLTLEGTAAYYDAVMRLADLLSDQLPIDLKPQRHEALVEDFEGQSRALCKTLGLRWTDDMADFAERSRRRAIATPSAAQVAGGLSEKGVGEWRRYRTQLAPVLPVLAPWVERFGYAAD